MRRLVLLVSLLLLFFCLLPAFADDAAPAEDAKPESLELHYFYHPGCSFCIKQSAFFDERIIPNYPEVNINRYNLDNNKDVLNELAFEYGIKLERIGTPMTFVAGEFFFGFGPSTGAEIEAVVASALGREPAAGYYEQTGSELRNSEAGTPKPILLNIPLVGLVDARGFALPLAAVVIGSVDGLNVCSIGALILILTIVIRLESRKKTLLFGGLFLLTTAVVYGGLVFVWYGTLSQLFQYLQIMKFVLALAGIIGGVYFFRRFLLFRKYGPGCDIQSNKLIVRLQDKVGEVISRPGVGIAAIAAVLIAFAAVITVVELPCSIALPMIFSGLLAESGAGIIPSMLLILMYLFFYLLIELVVLVAAVYTKRVWYGPDKAVIWVTLLASLVLFGIGAYYLGMIVRPM
ncbi:MAG: hypothetical protein D6B26_02560 [Spirochaetaceae bacterium]|nr:MAG: hypothetical protein D6B26_02560 [Spirochaetaceae bacterium]